MLPAATARSPSIPGNLGCDDGLGSDGIAFCTCSRSRSGCSDPFSLRTIRAAVLGGLDVHDLELEGAARCGYLDRLALLLADDRLADRRLVRELRLRRVGLRGADDHVLDRLVRVDVLESHLGADRHDA